ncbi:MAG: alpha/beta hydrolase [Chloroflexi bacterium]|nr:alpha/beta hydrolase [Chloroflexota bacterium]
MGYRRFEFDGGTVEYLVDGPPDATELLLFHVGTPSAAVLYPGLVAAAAARGIRTAAYSRGGYGRSSRRPGRSVADEAAISAALVDRLGFERFITVGWSGGGPVALACAALLPDRVGACMALASLAPRLEAGAEFDAWIPADQRAEWDTLASDDQSALIDDFEAQVGVMSRMTPARLRAVGGPPDARAVAYHHREEIAPALTRSMRRAVLQGHAGYLDDNVAQARPWGFRAADIRVPVVVRHGELDRLVDIRHGRWLARTIPGARGVFLPDAGHGSIALPWTEVLANLLDV